MTAEIETEVTSAPVGAPQPARAVKRTGSWSILAGRTGHAVVGRSRSEVAAWPRSYLRNLLVADALCALVCLAIAMVCSGVVRSAFPLPLPYLALLLVGPVAWVASLATCHGYERRYLGVGTEEYRAAVSAAVRLLAAFAFASYALYVHRPYFSRYFVLLLFPLLLASSLLTRFGLRKSLHRARRRGRSSHRALVVGQNAAVQSLVKDLHREPLHGLDPVAACTTDACELSDGVPRAGSVAETVRVARQYAADVVVVASPSGLDGFELRRLSWELDDLGAELIVSPGVVEVTGPRMSIRPAANLSLLHIERPALHGLNALTKAAFDRLVALGLLLALSPLFLVLALLIKLGDGGSVFFRQTRVGMDGRDFSMLKFRSMVLDAESRLAKLRAETDDGNGVLFKLRDDPRVTRIGRILRRYSLDELPQLINVLRGEMSIVGPRPPLRAEVDIYGDDAVRRLRVKPGLTGLWQVSGRSLLSWEESIRLDLRYVDNWSMLFDLQILWRTARAVLRGTGAY